MIPLAEDSAALASAASAAEDALRLEREALSVLRDTWTGDAATAAIDFLDAHCREGEAVVSALRHASDVLAALGDSTDLPSDPVDTGLDGRAPSNFAAPAPPPAAAPAPAMTWPAGGAPALPDIGSAIADLIAQAADSLSPDVLDAEPSVTDPVLEDPLSGTVAPATTPEQPVEPPVPEPAPVTPAPPLAAEAPPSPPVSPVLSPPAESLTAVEVPTAGRTPCEIAADELPQVGE